MIRTFSLRRLPLLAAAALLAACVGGQPPATAMQAADPGFARVPAGLKETIHELWRTFPGKTGIAVRRIDGDWSLEWRGDDLFPQQSVSKLWVCMAALAAVDDGRLRLSDPVRIGPDDLTLFHQPIATRVRTEGSISLTVGDLIERAITESDNSANDALRRAIGGSDTVRGFIASRKLGAIRFGPGERLLQAGIAGMAWDQTTMSINNGFEAERAKLPAEVRQAAMDRYLADPVDGASPRATANALARLARGELLSRSSTDYLLATMERTRTGATRLKAGLPTGWRFGHKTGTGQSWPPITAGYNNIGIATAPDGTRYAIAVYMADTTAPNSARMQLMQSVARAVAAAHGQ